MGNFSNYWDLHTLFTKLKNKLKSISDKIDDSVSLKSATGNPITLTDAANANAEELSMTIEPIQSGSGDPSPTNVRPISGLTEGKVVACGKNLIDITKYAISPLTLEDGILTGTATQFASKLSLNSAENPTLNVPLSEAYAISVAAYTDGNIQTEGSGIWVQILYEDGTYSTVLRFPNNTTTRTTYTATFNKKPVKIGINYAVQGANIWHIDSIQLEVGSTATPYEPYTGATASITFGQTVYGGSVNFKTGALTLTHKLTTVGALTWTSQTSSFANFVSNFLASEIKKSNDEIVVKSDIYTGVTNNKPEPTEFGIYANSTGQIKVNDRRYSTISAFETECANAQICFELATPTTLTLTPAELELLKGNNTITANGAEISLSYYSDNAIGVLAGRVDNLQEQINNKVEIQNNAAFHNSIYRGKYLGSEVTAEQYAAIAAGIFDDMYIGDYWTIDGVNYRIAHFNYWLRCGDTECITPHIVLVPDTILYNAKMNDSDITTGAYVGSVMYTTNLAQAKTIINNAFGASHILNHREYLANAMSATADPTYESAGSWYHSTVELMNERMVYGADVFHNVEVNGAIPTNYTIDKSQLALFALDPSRICNRAHWWLRDAVSAENFARVLYAGHAFIGSASNDSGVRPAFGIKA